MSTDIRFPQSSVLDGQGNASREWLHWFQNPDFVSVNIANALGVTSGGTGLTGGTSGGILGFTASDQIESSALLDENALVLGGGVGATPATPVDLGTATTLLHGNATGAPSWSSVDLAADVTGVLPVIHGGTELASLTIHALYVGNGIATPTALAVGATNTVLHGNSGADPSFSAVSLTADVSGQLPLANGGTQANLSASNGGIFYSNATTGAILAGTATAGQMLRSGASAAPSWSTATYPDTAGTAGNVARSDGTNFLSAALATTDLSDVTSGTWTPTWTSLTAALGGGTVSHSGTWKKIGSYVFWTARIAVTGAATTASTAGSTYINNLPFTVAVYNSCLISNINALTTGPNGVGMVNQGGTLAFATGWTAYNGDVFLSGWYSV